MERFELYKYMEKHSRQEAAVFFQVSLSALDRRIKKWGLTKFGWGSRKLNQAKADLIRHMYSTDKYTQKQLADIFKISRETINKIVNGKVYPAKSNIGFSGTADVKVTYLYVANQ